MQKGKLLKDVESIVVRGRIYGRSGDEVSIVADFTNVFIVEDRAGGRWPVKKELVEIKQIIQDTAQSIKERMKV